MRFHFAIDLYSSWVEFSITLRMRLVFWWQQTGTCWDRGQSLSALELGSFQEGVWSQGILVRKWQGMLGRTGGPPFAKQRLKGDREINLGSNAGPGVRFHSPCVLPGLGSMAASDEFRKGTSVLHHSRSASWKPVGTQSPRRSRCSIHGLQDVIWLLVVHILAHSGDCFWHFSSLTTRLHILKGKEQMKCPGWVSWFSIVTGS